MKQLIAFALLLLLARVAVADDMADIPVIDTHIHLYDTTRPQGLPWPPEGDKTLYRPVLPKHFDEVAEKNGITATVIVEASEWVGDNDWVLDLTRHDSDRYIGLVGSLPIGTDQFASQLRRLGKNTRFVGIRMRQRPGGEKFFTDAVWRDLRLLAQMNQTLDVLMFQFSLDDVDHIARRVPELKILINHVAGADIDGKQPADEWIQGVQRAAKNKNVYCKISGLFQQSHRSPSPKQLEFYKPTLDVLWEAFGEDRLIFGSNWPVSIKGGDYASYKAIVTAFITPHGRTAAEKLFYRNALDFYGLAMPKGH